MGGQQVVLPALLWLASWIAARLAGNCAVSQMGLRVQNDVSGTWTTRINNVQMNVSQHTNASTKHVWSYGEWRLNVTLASTNCTSQKTTSETEQTDWNHGVIIVDVNSRQNETDNSMAASTEQSRYPGYAWFPDLGLYKLHTEHHLSWVDARDACDAEQAYLVVVNSQREAEAVHALFRPHGRGSLVYAYVGLSDLQSEGHFVSVLGEAMESVGYNNWDYGQPDGRRGEDCVVISRLGALSDAPCNTPLPYICEAWMMP